VSRTPGKVTVRAPAKINLRLAVGPLGPDGFHQIDTVFHAVDLYDDLSAVAAGSLSLSVCGPLGTDLAADSRNLAWRAAELLASHAGVRAGAELRLDKHIPVAAGLAGGSADAAAALLACDRLWNLATPAAELAALAARLGSDVAFGLLGGCAVGTGRGQRLRPIGTGQQFSWVLAAAGGQLSTPMVYAELDRRRRGSGTAPAPPAAPEHSGLMQALASGDPRLLAPQLSNDLQPAAIALAPYLADTLTAGRDAGALAGNVSGSGPTCAFLAHDRDHADELARTLAAGGSCRQAFAVLGGSATPTVEIEWRT